MKIFANFYLRLINSRPKNPLLLFLLWSLYLLSWIYLLAIKILRDLRTKKRAYFKIPIISVGNITWGGSGKTPLVIEIANYIKNRGIKSAIIHRGKYYRDEIQMLEEKLPALLVLEAKSKIDSVRKIERGKLAEIVILDDGYQQWGLNKNLEILCLNYNAIFGNGYLIPRGNLREEPESLRRADLILINKVQNFNSRTQVIKEIRRYNPKAEIIFAKYKVREVIDLMKGTSRDFETLKELPSAILTAVADPVSVKRSLGDLGVDLRQEFIYPDHYRFSLKDLLRIKDKLRRDVEALFITEKDYAKIKFLIPEWSGLLAPREVLVLKIGLEFLENEEALFRRLSFLLANSRI